MIECFNDLISIVILLSVPFFTLGFILYKKLGKRKEKIIVNSEKYYREW